RSDGPTESDAGLRGGRNDGSDQRTVTGVENENLAGTGVTVGADGDSGERGGNGDEIAGQHGDVEPEEVVTAVGGGGGVGEDVGERGGCAIEAVEVDGVG